MLNVSPNTIILNALREIGLLGLERESQPSYLALGLDIFNRVVNSFSQDVNLLPYDDELEFQTQSNKEDYLINNEGTGDKTALRPAAITEAKLRLLNTTDYIQNIQVWQPEEGANYEALNYGYQSGYPTKLWYRNQRDGVLVSLYPRPSDAFTIQLRVKYPFNTPYTAEQPLTDFPPEYEDFLVLMVAQRAANYWRVGNNFTPVMAQELERLRKNIKSRNYKITKTHNYTTPRPEGGRWRYRGSYY